jgi:hypothetical protein
LFFFALQDNNPSSLLGGGELSFFTPGYSFPARKKLILVGHNTKYRNIPEKTRRFVARPKFANVALSLSRGEATSTLTHPVAYTIAKHPSGISTNAFVQTFLSLWGRLGQSG